MFEAEKNTIMTQTHFPQGNASLKQKLEGFLSALMTKLKVLLKSEGASSGIHFYIEMDD